MRSSSVSVGLGLSFAVCAIGACALVVAGCTVGNAPLSGDGGLADASPGDGGGGGGDGGGTDGGATDAGSSACSLMGTSYDKTCGTASDCVAVPRGCYCGAQPIIGVASSAAVAAQACEKQAASNCALGCPNAPGGVAEDGKNNADGGSIQAICDAGKCQTVLR